MTYTIAGIGRPCFHVQELPDWAPPDAACAVCHKARPWPSLSPGYWNFHLYDETGSVFTRLPRHPGGIHSAIAANLLKEAGWLERSFDRIWGRLSDDGEYTLEEAYETEFGSKP